MTRMESLALIVVALIGAGACSHQPTGTAVPPCHSSTLFDYNPTDNTRLTVSAFPDDYYTVDDSSSLTGLAVNITPENALWTTYNIPDILSDVLPAFNQLDGFGTSAGIALRLTAALGALPNGEADSLSSPVLQLWELGSSPHRIPYETQLTDNNDTVIVWPMIPLKPETPHIVILTRDAPTAAGDPVCPSPTFAAMLDGSTTAPSLKRLSPRYVAALKAIGVKAGQVGAGVLFTTQSITEQSVAIAADIKSRKYSWSVAPTCTPMTQYQLCSGSFVAYDYRDSDGAVTGTKPVAPYTLTARIWLPLTAPKPWPVLIFGHGLGGDTSQGDPLGALAAPLGIATIAIDAVDHGQHPGAIPNASTIQVALSFFGLASGKLEPFVLRDNWRQSNYDKLQLLRLLLDSGDLDGDGVSDIDAHRLAYYGVSLSGIMGPEFLTLEDDVSAAVLSVPGGRVTSIVETNAQFAPLISLAGTNNTPGDFDRFYPMLQALIERGDSVNYGPHILRDRLPGAPKTPDVLFFMVLNDGVVGNVSNDALARAMDIPELPPVLTPVGIIPVLSGTSVTGNLDNGQITGALFQYDRMTMSPGAAPVPANHQDVSRSIEGLYQTQVFLQSWVDGGTPEIVNPYTALNTPPLPTDGGQ